MICQAFFVLLRQNFLSPISRSKKQFQYKIWPHLLGHQEHDLPLKREIAHSVSRRDEYDCVECTYVLDCFAMGFRVLQGKQHPHFPQASLVSTSAAGQATSALSADVARLKVGEIPFISLQMSITGVTVKPIDEERIVNTVLHTNRTLGAAEVKAELLVWSRSG